MGWGCCLRYLPCAIHGPGHLDHGFAIHGFAIHGFAIHGCAALRRRSGNTPIPCLKQLRV